jgi:hypothetical protein
MAVTNNTVFWDVTPCTSELYVVSEEHIATPFRVEDEDKHEGIRFWRQTKPLLALLTSSLPYFSTLKTEVIRSFETSGSPRTACRCNPEIHTLRYCVFQLLLNKSRLLKYPWWSTCFEFSSSDRFPWWSYLKRIENVFCPSLITCQVPLPIDSNRKLPSKWKGESSILFNWIIGAHIWDCCADYRVFSV